MTLKRGDLVAIRDDGNEVGVVLAVSEPGIVRVRWGTDDHAAWYSSNDLYRVKLNR